MTYTFELVVPNQFPYGTPCRSLVFPIGISIGQSGSDPLILLTVSLAEPYVIRVVSTKDDNSAC